MPPSSCLPTDHTKFSRILLHAESLLSHRNLTMLAFGSSRKSHEAHALPLVCAIRQRTLGKADSCEHLTLAPSGVDLKVHAMQPFREIREIRVRQKTALQGYPHGLLGFNRLIDSHEYECLSHANLAKNAKTRSCGYVSHRSRKSHEARIVSLACTIRDGKHELRRKPARYLADRRLICNFAI